MTSHKSAAVAKDTEAKRAVERPSQEANRRSLAATGFAPALQLHRMIGNRTFGHAARALLSELPASVRRVVGSSGQPLEPTVQAFMERRFGHDFGRVRVHTHPSADESATGVSAKAYTVGTNIVFQSGEYSPGTIDGRRLIAHELAHVVQQSRRRGSASGVLGNGPYAPTTAGEQYRSTAAESEADHVATQAVMGRSVSVHAVVPGGIQRKPLREEKLELSIADLDKRIAEIEERVTGVSRPAAEEQGLFEERERLLAERAELQAQLNAPTSPDPRLEDPLESRRRLKELKNRLTESRSYPGREDDQAEFDAMDGPLLSYLEDVQLSRGNHYAQRVPEGWIVKGVGFIEASEGGTTTAAIKSAAERERLEAERERLEAVERAGGDVALHIYHEWQEKWSERLKKAVAEEKALRAHLKAKLGDDAFGSAWIRFQNGVEYNDDVWLDALGTEYRDVHVELAWAERMAIADPNDVVMCVRMTLDRGKRPTEDDLEKFAEIAWRNRELREMVGAGLSFGRGGGLGSARMRFSRGKPPPKALKSPPGSPSGAAPPVTGSAPKSVPPPSSSVPVPAPKPITAVPPSPPAPASSAAVPRKLAGPVPKPPSKPAAGRASKAGRPSKAKEGKSGAAKSSGKALPKPPTAPMRPGPGEGPLGPMGSTPSGARAYKTSKPTVEWRTPTTPDYGTPEASGSPRGAPTRPMKKLPEGARRGSMGQGAGDPVAHPQSRPTVEVRTQKTPDYGKPEYSVGPESQGPDPWKAPPQPTKPPAPRARPGHHPATGQAAKQAQAQGMEDLQKGRVGMQEHRTAPAVREATGRTGQNVDSTHLVPQAVYRELGVSPDLALTVNLPKAVNNAIDSAWVPKWTNATRLGQQITGSDVRKWVTEGIRKVPDSMLSKAAKNSLEWRFDVELRGLGISDDTIIVPRMQ